MKEAWVPKREWKRKESGACLKMEQKNKTHPSLPSNYVTLAQLQERWLKQQNQIKQQAQQQQQQQQQKDKEEQQKQEEEEEEKHVAVVAPTNVTVSRSHRAEQHRRKNREDSGNNNRRADEVASENCRKLEAGAGIGENRWKLVTGAAIGENRRKSEAGIGDEKADLDGKVGESKKKKKKWNYRWKGKMKPKAVERGAIEDEGAAAKGNEVAEKTTTESELNDEKNVNTTKVEEVEQQIGGLSINPSNGKGKMKPKVEERGTIEEEGAAAKGNEVAEKTTTESQLNDEKNVNTTKVEEVEQKIGGLSINPNNGKGKMKPKVEERGTIEEEEGAAAQGNEVAEKTTTESELNDEKNVNTTKVEEAEQRVSNWKFRRINNGFRHFQSQRNYRAGGYGNFREQQQRSNVRSIWVRKDGGVGEIEP